LKKAPLAPGEDGLLASQTIVSAPRATDRPISGERALDRTFAAGDCSRNRLVDGTKPGVIE
jgi:hypothetical protein